MGAFRQLHTDHAIAHQPDLRFLAIHQHCPAAVLGNGGIEQTIPVAGDGAFHQGIAEPGQLQGGGLQDLIALPEAGIVQNCRRQGHGALLIFLAAHAHRYHIAHCHIAHCQHLGQAHGLGVQLDTVEADAHIVPLGQIQVHAQKSILLHRVGIADLGIFGTAGIGTVAAGIPVGNGHILAGDLQGAAGEGVPHIPGNTRCSGKDPVLKAEYTAVLKAHLCQLPLRQEGQGQVGGVLIEIGVAVMVDIVKIGALLILAVPVQHIFQSQEQIGYG